MVPYSILYVLSVPILPLLLQYCCLLHQCYYWSSVTLQLVAKAIAKAVTRGKVEMVDKEETSKATKECHCFHKSSSHWPSFYPKMVPLASEALKTSTPQRGSPILRIRHHLLEITFDGV